MARGSSPKTRSCWHQRFSSSLVSLLFCLTENSESSYLVPSRSGTKLGMAFFRAHFLAHYFADDTSLFLVVENPDTATELLNLDLDLDKITAWAKRWLVRCNPVKTEAFLASRKLLKPIYPPHFMDGTQILEVDSHKNLGIIFQKDLSLHKRIVYVKEKAWSRVNAMRKLKFDFDRKSLETIYITFIRPILEYADTVWDNCT